MTASEDGTTPESADLVEHAFRHDYGRIVARLTRSFGPKHLDLVEESAQDAFLSALRVWPFRGPPEDTYLWLLRVAQNRAIDRLRRRARFDELRLLADVEAQALSDEGSTRGAAHREGPLRDDTLRLIFMCCDPALTRTARVSLTLKVVCGFTTGEIADAFGTSESTVAQRIVRSKRALRDGDGSFELPPPEECKQRLTPVLDVLFLLFNEGYRSARGPSPIRQDLVGEAIRLAELLAETEIGRRPEIAALRALFWLQSSRLGARLDADGAMIALAQQDRQKWNRTQIARGLSCLGQAAQGSHLSDYHLLAEIAAVHATAPSAEETDWDRILRVYEVLHLRRPSFVIDLNRAIAIAQARGPEAGLHELERLRNHSSTKTEPLFFSTRAELLTRCGRREEALVDYREAIGKSHNIAERKFLQRRVNELNP